MTISVERPILYPDSDGQPMADNTRQFQWIVLIKENLECCFVEQPEVFVAGDLLWYPVEGEPKIRVAPDVFVVFGRPKGDRGSYRQWEEGQIAPQVVFEILSPGNRIQEMANKQRFYERYGVEEYYIYDPDRHHFNVLQRQGTELKDLEDIDQWTSPRLGIHFEFTPEALTLYRPDGEKFLTTIELAAQRAAAQEAAATAQAVATTERQRAEAERQRAETEHQRAEAEHQRAEAERQCAEAEHQRAEAERQRAEAERQRAEAERQRVERLTAQLRALGIEPDLAH